MTEVQKKTSGKGMKSKGLVSTDDSSPSIQDGIISPETGGENEESAEIFGEQSDGSLDDGFVAQSGVDLLEQLLGSSKAEEAKESPKSGLVIPTKEEFAAIVAGDIMGPLYQMNNETGEVKVVAEGTGPQPNGDYGIVIQVREGLWNGVSSQAEMERESPEAWLSRLVNEYLEGWFFGKG